MSKDNFIQSAESLNIKTRYTCPSRPPSRPYKYHLYPVKQISTLHTALQAKKDNDVRIIQYIVTSQKKLLLAQEGSSSTFTPTHKEMMINPARVKATVRAAGYLFLNTCGEIIGISNESEDFSNLSRESLLYPVAILHLMNAPIAKTFSVILTSDTDQFELTLEDRQTIVDKLPLNLIQEMLAANQSTKVIVRKPMTPEKIIVSTYHNIPFSTQCTEARELELIEEQHYVPSVECSS